MKKSYCEMCHNESCDDRGIRNPFMIGNHQCTRYVSAEDVQKKIEAEEEKKKLAGDSVKRIKDYLDGVFIPNGGGSVYQINNPYDRED